jgi:hypothetical protein
MATFMDFKYDEFEKGFETMVSGHAGKVILNWREFSER